MPVRADLLPEEDLALAGEDSRLPLPGKDFLSLEGEDLSLMLAPLTRSHEPWTIEHASSIKRQSSLLFKSSLLSSLLPLAAPIVFTY